MFRLLAALMLATIGLQATPARPVLPLRDHGSAFSASTAEVAVAARRERAEEVRVVEQAPALLHIHADLLRARPALPVSRTAWPAVQARGPPPRDLRGPAASPRAPPLS